MDNQLRIAIVGRSQVVNTSCARYLYWHYKFRMWGMDDEMDKFLRYLNDWPPKRKHYFPWETRLKFYDAWQAIDHTLWAKRIVRRANDKRMTYHVVVPDVRYLEEVKYLEENGFIFIRVHAKPKAVNIRKSLNTGGLAFYEWFSKDADVYVKAEYSINHHDLPSTRKALDEIIKDLTAKRGISKIDKKLIKVGRRMVEIEEEISTLNPDDDRGDISI